MSQDQVNLTPKLINQFDPDNRNRALLEGIQGNILKAHGRHHTANIFINCDSGKQEKAKAWLKSLVNDENSLVRSAYDQLRNNVLWKEKCVDSGLFACIHISAIGYTYLFGNDAKADAFEKTFLDGMQKADLGDPEHEDWEVGLRAANHFMLLVGHAEPDKLAEVVERIQQETDVFGSITTIEEGLAQFNKAKAGIEHFGYVDGVSQPLFFADEWETYKTDNNIGSDEDIKFDPRADKGIVLLKDPFGQGDDNALGSYFVFRKLEQNVKGFKLAESQLADRLELAEGDDERAGAMLVGRFEDGTPVQLDFREGLINNSVLNNFAYDPADASKCPYHAHIRKVNPRFDPVKKEDVQVNINHMMARRGIPFGTRTDEPNDGHIYNKPEKDVGLLFMSYQKSITNQFEFIQKNWANSPNQPTIDPDDTDGPNAEVVGIDPVIGQIKGGQNRISIGEFAKTWRDPESMKEASFEQFVTMKGGGYFFAPSMSFLENL